MIEPLSLVTGQSLQAIGVEHTDGEGKKKKKRKVRGRNVAPFPIPTADLVKDRPPRYSVSCARLALGVRREDTFRFGESGVFMLRLHLRRSSA